MLPDFPETKQLFSRFFRTYARRKARLISPFGEVQTKYIHEGRGMKIVRADRSESNTQVEQLSSQMEIRFDEQEYLTFENALRKHDEMILDMVRKQVAMTLERMDEEIPASQMVDAKGKPPDAELILQMLETMEIEFYPDGTPHELHVIGGLFTPERMQAAEDELNRSPVLRKRHDKLMAEKKRKWRDREASRKLVG